MSLDDDEDLGDDPLEWLQHGHTLFAQLFSGDGCTYSCADGTEIEVTEDDEELLDKTYLDDCSTYGFLIQLKKDTVTLRTAVLRDISGECKVEVVKDAGFFEEKMAKFIKSFGANVEA